MAEGEIIPIGLALDTSQLLRGVQQAQAALTQMGASTQQATDALTKLRQAQAQATDALTQQRQASTQATGALTQLRDAQTQATQAATQAKAAALAYRQEQDALRESLRQQRDAQRQANEEATKASAGLGGMSSATRIATGVLGAFGVALSAQAVVQFGKSVVETGAKLEALQRSLVAVTGSHKAANDATMQAATMANRLGLSTVTLTEAYRGFLAATRGTALEGAAAQKVFEAVTVASGKLGSTNEQTARAFVALQQIVSKGVVSQEELRGQLSEALPGAYQISARAMGLTTAELSKFIEKGADGLDFVNKFGDQLIKEFGGGSTEAVNTATANFARLENEWTNLKARIANAGPLRFITTIADSAAATLNVQTMREQELQTRMVNRADAAAGPTARNTTVPGILALAKPEERLALLDAERKLLEIEEGRAALAKQPDTAGGAAMRAEATRQREIAQLTTIDAILADIEIRRQSAGKLQAITEPGGDPGADFYQRALAIDQKAKDRLDALDKTLRELERRTAQLLAGQTAARAKELTAEAREERAKLIEKALGEVATLRAGRPAGFGGVDAALDQRIGGYGRSLPTEKYKASPWRGLVEPISERYGVDPRLVEAVIAQESGNNSRAVSKAGARGLMQLMPGTGRDMGLAAGMEFEPEANITAGVKYLAEMLRLFGGNVEKALTAYNAGPKGGGIPNKTAENIAYAPAVLARMPQGDDKIADEASRATKRVEDIATYQKRLAGEVAAADHNSNVARAVKLAEGEAIIAQLDRMTAAYAKPKEARDQDTASALVAKAVMTDEIATRAKLAEGLLLNAIAEKEHADAVEKATKVYASAEQSLDRYQEQLGLSGGGKITSEARAVTRAEKDLLALRGGPREAEAQKVVDGLKVLAKEAEPGFQQLTRLSEDFADSFLSTMERATQGGIKSFKEFAQSVLQDLMRMASQEYLKPQLSKWINAGLQAATSYFGGAAGGTGAAGTATVNADYGNYSGMASGGPVTSNTPYVVGERGAEVFVPSQNGTIVPHGASVSQRQGQQAPPMIVNIYGVQDAAGLARSRGEIQRQMLSAFQQAQRAA